MPIQTSYQPKTDVGSDVLVMTELESTFSLLVWNDEVNTFEWVIETLMEICGHSEEQAEQCAMIIHNNGKYAFKMAATNY